MSANPAVDERRCQEHYELNYRPYLPADKDTAILDIGCGYGLFLQYLWEQGYRQLKGVDIDGTCVEACRQRRPIEIERIESLQGYIQHERQRFDLITMIEVANYFPLDRAAERFRELKRLLTPQGRLIVEVVNGAVLTGEFYRFKDTALQATFTEHSLRQALEVAGYTVEALFGDRIGGRSLKRLGWLAARELWFWCLAGIYVLERGRDPANPTIFSKLLIAVARPSA